MFKLVFTLIVGLFVFTSPVSADIPKDAIHFEGHYYKICDEGLTWHEAQNFCVVKGGHLVVMESPNNAAGKDAALKKLVGTYTGSYFANQGETGLTLTVFKNEYGEFKALFDFYNLPGRNNAKAGKYYMTVDYDIYSQTYILNACEWIDRPQNYGFVSLRGTLRNSTLSGNNPTKFSVRRMN